MWEVDRSRLLEAMKIAGVNQAQLADAVGLRQPSIGRLLSGETKTSRAIDAIAEFLKTSPEFLKGASDDPSRPGESPNDAVAVPILDLGELGDLVSEDSDAPVPSPTFPFPRGWLQSMIAGDVSDVVALSAVGDAMAPTLLEGDLALADRAQTEVTCQDRVFWACYGGRTMLRRVRQFAPDRLLLMADNTAIAPIEGDLADVDLLGRVIWYGRAV